MSTKTPAELREEADRLENEAAKLNKGKVYIYTGTGFNFIHDGRKESNPHYLIASREATEAEVTALCVIPELAAYLKKVREG